MATRIDRVKLGVFLLIAIALAAGGLALFAGYRPWQQQDKYYVETEQSVSGLEEGAPVKVRGVRVGEVGDIKLQEDGIGVVIELAVEEGTPIHSDAKAFVKLQGLSNLRYIDIAGGTAESPLLDPPAEIQAGLTTLDRLELVAERAEPLVDETEQFLRNLNQIIGPESRARMDRLFEQTEATLQNLRATSDNLRIASQQIAGVASRGRQLIDTASTEIEQTAESLQQTSTAVRDRIEQSDQVVEDVHTLVRRSRDPIEATLYDLRMASRNLREVSRELRQDPSQLLFSEAPEPRSR